MRWITATLLLLVTSTMALAGHGDKLAHLYDYRWQLVDKPNHTISTDKAAAMLKGYDVVFFGEMHEHPAVHLAQMELLEQLFRLNGKMTLSMEQFERDSQHLVDQYLAAEIGEEYLLEEANAWDNYRSSYRPLVEFARARKLPVIAANAPKPMVVCVGRSGLEVLDKYPTEQRLHVAKDIDVSDGAYQQMFIDAMNDNSAHKAPEDSNSKKIMQAMVKRSYAAQAVRDDTMAESIARHIEKSPGRQVLHLNGNFHSTAFLGTVERLQRRMPGLKIGVIHAMTEQEDEQGDHSTPPGTLIIQVQSLPDKFVKPEHRQAWLGEMMEKRMEQRKECPQ